MSRLALRFISGKYKGGEYILSNTKDTFVGRSSNIDLVLMEDMVSRKHARIWVEDGQVNLEDFGSTNGTFVNGEKISRAVVNQGDRILIGTSIMKLVETDKEPRQTSSEIIPGSEADTSVMPARDGSSSSSASVSAMTGTIDEVPLPDLIQLLSSSKKTGTLIITSHNTCNNNVFHFSFSSTFLLRLKLMKSLTFIKVNTYLFSIFVSQWFPMVNRGNFLSIYIYSRLEIAYSLVINRFYIFF